MVEFVAQVGKRKRKRDGKVIDVPLMSPCGAQQYAIKLGGYQVALTLGRPGAPLNFVVSDLTDAEKDQVKEAVEARFQAAPSVVAVPPADEVNENED